MHNCIVKLDTHGGGKRTPRSKSFVFTSYAHTLWSFQDFVHFYICIYTKSSSLHLIWCCTFSGKAIISIITWQGLASFISTPLENMRLTVDCAVGHIANRWGSGPCFIRGSAVLFGLKQPRTIVDLGWTSTNRDVPEISEADSFESRWAEPIIVANTIRIDKC